jgi:hypothetical protein
MAALVSVYPTKDYGTGLAEGRAYHLELRVPAGTSHTVKLYRKGLR